MQVALLDGKLFVTEGCDVIGLVNVHEEKPEVLDEFWELCLVETLLELLQEDFDTLAL